MNRRKGNERASSDWERHGGSVNNDNEVPRVYRCLGAFLPYCLDIDLPKAPMTLRQAIGTCVVLGASPSFNLPALNILLPSTPAQNLEYPRTYD